MHCLWDSAFLSFETLGGTIDVESELLKIEGASDGCADACYECPYFQTGRYEDIGKDDKKYKIRGRGTEMQVTEA